MKKIILCFLSFLLFSQYLQSQKAKQLKFVPSANVDSGFKQGNYECQVLQLTNQNRQTSIMIVFIDKGGKRDNSRTRLRCNYLFKRERIYLKNVFFSDVEILENYNDIVDANALMLKFTKDYYQPQLWSVLNSHSFFNTAPQR